VIRGDKGDKEDKGDKGDKRDKKDKEDNKPRRIKVSNKRKLIKITLTLDIKDIINTNIKKNKDKKVQKGYER